MTSARSPEIGNTQTTVGTAVVGTHGAGLANSYTPMPAWYEVRKFYPPKIPRRFDFLYRFLDLVDPAPWYRSAHEYASQPIVGVQGQVYVLGPDQRALQALNGQRFSDSLLNSMKTQSRWLGALDPVRESDVVSLALSADGRAILNAAVLRNGKLVSAAEAGMTFGSQLLPPTTTAPVSSFFVDETSSVYRVTEGRELWRFKLGIGWSKTVLTSSVAPLLAAAYSTADKNIWALDQPDSRTVRLLRISGTQVTELSRTPRRTDVTQYFMSLDQNGSVVVTTVAPARTVITRVQSRLRYQLMSRNQFASTLQQPPTASSDGFLLVSFDGTSSWSVESLAGAAPAQSLASIY